MSKKLSLKIILGLSVAGMLFSGYLSYMELFAGGCGKAIVSCGENTRSIFSLPACVYGFFMYLLVFVAALTGLLSKEKNSTKI